MIFLVMGAIIFLNLHFSKQQWEVRLRDHDTYSIEKPQYIPGPPGAFGADEIRPGAAVEYKREPATWVITALDEERFAYRFVCLTQGLDM